MWSAWISGAGASAKALPVPGHGEHAQSLALSACPGWILTLDEGLIPTPPPPSPPFVPSFPGEDSQGREALRAPRTPRLVWSLPGRWGTGMHRALAPPGLG